MVAVACAAACERSDDRNHDAAVALDAASGDAATATSDAAVTSDGGGAPDDWRAAVIYLAVTDRFFNGDAANDALGLPGCLDPADPQKFHGGDFAGLQQKLGYLTDLGATALWATPAYRQATGPPGRCGYHGYWADFTDPDDGAVEPRLGSAADLNALVAALHGAGLRFILDMVVNHAGDGAALATQHPDWFHDPATCAQLGDPAVYCPYRAGVHDFAQEKPEVAAYLDGVGRGWVSRVALDGIRMDTAKYVLPGYFRDSWIPAVRGVRPLFLVAEVFSETPADLPPYLDAGFDSAFNFPLRRALVNAFALGQSVDTVADVIAAEQTLLGARAGWLVNLIDNHDTPRLLNEPGTQVAVDELRRRLHLALAAMFLLPGIPQLYAGDELALYGGDDPDNRRDLPAWAWDAAGRTTGDAARALPAPQATWSFVQTQIMLRRSNRALVDGTYKEVWRQNGAANPNLLAFFRSAANNRLLAALHNGAQPSGAVAIPLPASLPAADQAALADGAVLDELIGAGAATAITVSAGAWRLALPAQTAALYRPRELAQNCAATFSVSAPSGVTVGLAGAADELGAWDAARAVRLTAGGCAAGSCTYSVTLRYLPYQKPFDFKFVQINNGAFTWESGANRNWTVPSAPAATYDGMSFRN